MHMHLKIYTFSTQFKPVKNKPFAFAKVHTDSFAPECLSSTGVGLIHFPQPLASSEGSASGMTHQWAGKWLV